VTWFPARSALLTAGGLLAAGAVAVAYVVNADAQGASPVVPATAPVVSGSASTTAVPSALAPTAVPSTAPPLLPVTPEPAVTLSLAPSLPRTPSPSRPTSSPTPAPTLRTPEQLPILDFTLSTFNVLGASHTAGGGDKAGRPSGRVRARGAVTLIARHGADVVGFQELQMSQLGVLRQRTGMDFHPGSTMRPRDSENSIGWRRDRWVAVERHTVDIPYFNGGRRAMPYVRLRSTSTGLEAWFANFHNPAETADFHHQQRFRSTATRIEIALANRLMATGLPVFVTGDMNERSDYFCRFTAGAPMVAARGGSNNGACRAGGPRVVDWIFGSQGVQFSGYTEDRSRLVDVTTDHPVVTTRVRIQGRAAGTPGG
jgi:hypothetical protein